LSETLDAASRLRALEVVCDALAHPARRQILLTVHFRGGEMTAGEIAGRFSCAWPTTTRHLRVLESAGLLRHEKRGRTRVYSIDRARLCIVQEWLDWFGDLTMSAQTAKPSRRHGQK
jgi:DNA-binding transcriptional ArsR family regulator